MGVEKEVLKKNYYIDLGKTQGIKKGDILDVKRRVSYSDPFATKKRYTYNIKIGEIKVIHAEDGTSIAEVKELTSVKEGLQLEISGMMIGDLVDVKVN